MAEMEASAGIAENRVNRPPTWAPLLLGAALPVAVLLEVAALIVAGVVFPLFDLAPLWVLAVALVSMRWAGVSTKPFVTASLLAGLMLVEWIAWDVWYYFVVFGGEISTFGFDELVRRFGNPAVALLLIEMIALLVLFGRACLLSLKGVKKNMSQG